MYHSKTLQTLYTVISPFKTTIANGFKWCINLYEKGTKSRRVKAFIFYRPGISFKMPLFKSTVETVLLYSCDALAITETMARHLDASHRALMHYCLGVHFPVRLSNVHLYARTHVATCHSHPAQKSPSLKWSWRC